MFAQPNRIAGVKDTFDLTTYVERQRGPADTKTGRYKQWRCPLPGHADDNTPSFTIYSDQQHWECFGCGRSGDILDFVMIMENVELAEALDILDANTDLATPMVKPQRKERLDFKRSKHPWGFEFLRAMHNDASKLYFTRRGITEPVYNTNILGAWQNYTQHHLLDGQWYAVEHRRYVIPYIWDNTIWMANLRLDEAWAYENLHSVPKRVLEAHSAKTGHSLLYAVYGPKYKAELIKTQSMPYGLKRFVYRENGQPVYIQQPYVLLVEGEIDQMALDSYGYLAIAAKASHSPMIDRLPAILQNTDQVFIVSDNDTAGLEYARKMQKMLHRGEIIFPPEAKDTNDYILRGDPQKQLSKWLTPLGIEETQP